jgi:hypothetical protein
VPPEDEPADDGVPPEDEPADDGMPPKDEPADDGVPADDEPDVATEDDPAAEPAGEPPDELPPELSLVVAQATTTGVSASAKAQAIDEIRMPRNPRCYEAQLRRSG